MRLREGMKNPASREASGACVSQAMSGNGVELRLTLDRLDALT